MDLRTVLHVIPAAPFGGAQRLAVDLAQAQNRAGLEARIWFTNAGSAARDAALAAGLNVAGPVDGGGATWRRIRALRSGLRTQGVDVVHLHLPPPWFVAAASRRRNFVLVTHLHVQPPIGVRSRASAGWTRTKLHGVTLSRSDVLISISRWIEDAWRSAYPGITTPSRIVYNGTNIQSAVPRRKDTSVMGIATRLSPQKGVEEFLDLAARIHALAPHMRFRVAGEGPMRSEYEDRASLLGLRDVLAFSGFEPDIAAFWRDVDIGAFTAPSEPFGLRLIEPVAHGVPVIAYRNGSGSDEVIERCRGIAAVNYGQVEELATIAVALARSREKRESTAAAGIEDLRRSFSIERMEAEIRGIYRQLA